MRGRLAKSRRNRIEHIDRTTRGAGHRANVIIWGRCRFGFAQIGVRRGNQSAARGRHARIPNDVGITGGRRIPGQVLPLHTCACRTNALVRDISDDGIRLIDLHRLTWTIIGSFPNSPIVLAGTLLKIVRIIRQIAGTILRTIGLDGLNAIAREKVVAARHFHAPARLN